MPMRYFQNAANKVVVVGGDRAEIILAALETPTAAIVLTGSYVPSPAVLARARSSACPIVSVASDTVSATDGIQRLFGGWAARQRKSSSVAGRDLSHVDLDRLVAISRSSSL